MKAVPVHFYVAPAAIGKTSYLVEQVRAMSSDLAATPRVIVPTQLQVRTWRRRLGERGGALGVRVGTFDILYREILRAEVAQTVDGEHEVDDEVRYLLTVVSAD